MNRQNLPSKREFAELHELLESNGFYEIGSKMSSDPNRFVTKAYGVQYHHAIKDEVVWLNGQTFCTLMDRFTPVICSICSEELPRGESCEDCADEGRYDGTGPAPEDSPFTGHDQ